MKEVAIAGGTGFIGSRLANSLKNSNYDVKLIPSKILRMKGVGARTFGIDFKDHDYKLVSEFIDGSYALINLAGEPLCETWKSDTRSRIYSSRVDLTHLLVNAISYCHERPELFINTSSTEYYGNKGDKIIKESSAPGVTFLSRVFSEMEKQSFIPNINNLNVILVRPGSVIGSPSWIFRLICQLVKKGIKPIYGSSRRWFSWISIDDLINAYKFILENNFENKIINLVSEKPIDKGSLFQFLSLLLDSPLFQEVTKRYGALFRDERDRIAMFSSQRIKSSLLTKYGFKTAKNDLFKEITSSIKLINQY